MVGQRESIDILLWSVSITFFVQNFDGKNKDPWHRLILLIVIYGSETCPREIKVTRL